MKRVVLVRPSGPRNVGMVLRTVLNFGPCELALVAPERPSLLVHPEFEQMSHGVPDARERCVVHPDLPSALADCTRSVGFTARGRTKRQRATWAEIAGELAAAADRPGERVALVFGNEVTGLDAAECELLQELVHIPTATEHTSLNLAVAVAVVLSRLFTGAGTETTAAPEEEGARALNGDGREFLKACLKEVFGDRVARTPFARRDILASIDRVFSRAPLENRDARAWHLMLRALGSTLQPGDLGLRPSPEKGARRAQALERRRRRDEASGGEAGGSGGGGERLC